VIADAEVIAAVPMIMFMAALLFRPPVARATGAGERFGKSSFDGTVVVS
jgi:hypothetical protein